MISSVRDKNFRSLIRNMKTVEDNDFEIPTELEPILRGYQKTGFLQRMTKDIHTKKCLQIFGEK